jgi:hypothetical protein
MAVQALYYLSRTLSPDILILKVEFVLMSYPHSFFLNSPDAKGRDKSLLWRRDP